MVCLDLPLRDSFGSFIYIEEEGLDNYAEFLIIYFLFIYDKFQLQKIVFRAINF